MTDTLNGTDAQLIQDLKHEYRSRRVNALFRLSIFGTKHPNFDYSTLDPTDEATFPDDLEVVRGIMSTFGFSKEQLKYYKVAICKELDGMHDSFFNKGGDSFLNLAFDKGNIHWAEHPTMEQLIVLGMAIGLVKPTFERKHWDKLPGGMPYYAFNPEARNIANAE